MKVLVTGATEGFGLLLTKKLSTNPQIKQIIALKSSETDYSSNDDANGKLEFATAKNLRPRALEDVFKKNPDIDVVVHLAYSDKPQKNENGKLIHETNVFGTMRLLDLCDKYGVKKFVYKSPSSIYGANPDNPVLIKEDFPLRGNRTYQALRDKIEADVLCQMHIREGKDPKIVIFRFCGILGENIRSPLNTLFSQPFIPTIFGFDPMFQVIHEDDVVEAMMLSILDREVYGIFNAAGKYTQPVSDVIRRLGRIPLPISSLALDLLYKPYFMLKREHTFPFDINFWKYPFAVDTSKAKEILGFKAKIL
ncbi:MAG: NAD-dependent epimerase/dehydratase family protein [Candidatus Sericytochromatia bacterium]|nr:NAD-dependent epimerase/dehydratase family protein [Candidatus Sericytochromatia bacterium]